MRQFSMLVGIIMLSIQAVSQTKNVDKNKEQSSLLWEISGNGLSQPSYIFGTIHMICADDFIWSPVMDSTIKNVSQICFEMNIADPKIATKVGMSMMNPNGKLLSDYFNEADYKFVNRTFKDSLNISIETFKTMKPAVLQMLFASSLLQCPQTKSYEETIKEIGLKQGKTFTGLETAEEQISFMSVFESDSSIQGLITYLKDIHGSKQEWAQLVAAYQSKDLKKIEQVMQQAKLSAKEETTLLSNRNQAWVERIKKEMSNGSTLFAVGAAHLCGNGGIIYLLRQQGFTLSPIE